MRKFIRCLTLFVTMSLNFSCEYSLSDLKINQVIVDKSKLTGKVIFPESGFKIKNEIDSLSIGAVVSIILNNQTVATGLTDDNGNFTINLFDNFTPLANGVYKLEATRRLNNNMNKISISTNIKWDGTNWQSITQPQLFINDLTTAITIITDLNPGILSQSASINSVNYPYTTIPAVGFVTQSKLEQLTNKVNLTIKRGFDPYSEIKIIDNEFVTDSQKSTGEFIKTGICKYCDLTNANLERIKFKSPIIENSVSTNIKLFISDLSRGSFLNSDLKSSNISESNLSSSFFNNLKLNNSLIKASDLSSSYLDIVDLSNSDLTNSDFSSAEITDSIFKDAIMNGINLSNSTIDNSDFSNVKINPDTLLSNFSESDISNSNFTNSQIRGTNLSKTSFDTVNLTGANFTDSDLTDSYFDNVTISNTNFSNANLSGAYLKDVNMTNAVLEGANLSGATWTNGLICKPNSIGECLQD